MPPAYLSAGAVASRVVAGAVGWPVDAAAQAWWDPRDSANITIATGVSNHVDKLGGHAVANATGTQQPALNPTGINGKPALSYNRANSQRLAGAAALAAAIDITAPFTIMYMAQQTAGVSGQTRIALCGGDGTHVNILYSGALCGATDTNDRSRHGGTDFAGTGILAVTPHVFAQKYDGTTLVSRLDGVQTSSNASGASGVFSQLVFGGQFLTGAAYANFWDGLIGDIVVFTSALALVDIQAGEAWMAARYA